MLPHLKGLDWSMVNSSRAAPRRGRIRLFPMDKHYRWLGRSGAAGLGYGRAGVDRRRARQQVARTLHVLVSRATAT